MSLRGACLRCGSRKARPDDRRCPGCAKALIRVVADRFEVREWLACDGTSVSVRAWDRESRRETFGRVLLPTAGAEAQEALTREARLLLNHRGEAGFPALVDAGTVRETGASYLMQENVSVVSLDEAAGSLTPARRIEVFLDALSPVRVLHEEGLVHCALAPQHFRIAPDGRVVLLDFREVHAAGARADGTGRAAFRAPEQRPIGRAVGPYTDVFALGGILYLVLTGRYPYGRKGFGSGRKRRPPSQVNRRLPPELDAIVLRALASDPRERYASAAEMGEALAAGFGTATDPDDLDARFGWQWLNALTFAIRIVPAALTCLAVVCAFLFRQTAGFGRRAVGMSLHATRAHPRLALACLLAALSAIGLLQAGAWLPWPAPASGAAAGRATSSPLSHGGSVVADGKTKSLGQPIRGVGVPNRPLGEPPARLCSAVPAMAHRPTVVSPAPWDLPPLSMPFDDGDGSDHEAAADLPLATDRGRGRARFLTWPASSVYADGAFVTEAPSPELFTLETGSHTLELVSRGGLRRTLRLRLGPGRVYTLKYDFDVGRLDVEEIRP